MAYDDVFVSTEWLARAAERPRRRGGRRLLVPPVHNRDPHADYAERRNPGALRFDIDAVKDAAFHPAPHAAPARGLCRGVAQWASATALRIVVYDGLAWFSAPRVRWTFKTFGAKDVVILEGGFPKWQAEGARSRKAAPRARSARSFSARLDHSAVVDGDDVARALASAPIRWFDARPADRFRGEAPEPRAGVRSGHIPGSLNLPFPAIMEKGALKSPEAIAAAFSEAGVRSRQAGDHHLRFGRLAAILSTALETIGKPARALYDGSGPNGAPASGRWRPDRRRRAER